MYMWFARGQSVFTVGEPSPFSRTAAESVRSVSASRVKSRECSCLVD